MKWTSKVHKKLQPDHAILRLGYVSLLDSAPIVIGKELGFFDKEGLRVKISKVLGWASVRDKIIYSELDASQAVVGLPFAVSLGLGCPVRPCITPMILNLHGNSITLSEKIANNGVFDARSLGEWKSTVHKKLVFGVVSKVSTHYFLMKEFLLMAGLEEMRDYELVVIPPPLVCANLESGTIDGFCVGEPWNSIAAKKKSGRIIARSADLSPGHPEKVLMMTEEFAHKRHDEVILLNRALLNACEYCEENSELVAEIMARKEYLNIPAALLFDCLRGKSFEAIPSQQLSSIQNPFIFRRFDANRPSWAKEDWILQRMVAQGMASEQFRRSERIQRVIFREDIFDASTALTQKKTSSTPLALSIKH